MTKSPTVEDLKKQAKSMGLRGYSKLRKAELKQLIGYVYVYIPSKNRFRRFANII